MIDRRVVNELEVKEILVQELELLQQFLNLLLKETDILKKVNSKELQTISDKKIQMMTKLDEIESLRFQLMGPISFKEFVEGEGVAFAYLLPQYQQVILNIQEANETNRVLTQMGYDTTTDIIKIMTKPVKEPLQTYGHNGNIKEQNVIKAKLLNRQA
ncbi:MAG: flagellar export chaperone FlgN [Turicibacter sp.]